MTLCALGPMTNLALAFAKAPDVVARVARIVAMGGGWSEGGNTTPVAEFNILVDPQAAQAVFGAGVPVVLHPLDVTHKCLTHADRIAGFRALGNAAGVAVAEMLEFFERFDEAKYGTDGGPLHDPNVIAWLLRAAPLPRARRQSRGRDRLGADLGPDGGGLVGRHRPAEERPFRARGRRRRLLCAADGTDRTAVKRDVVAISGGASADTRSCAPLGPGSALLDFGARWRIVNCKVSCILAGHVIVAERRHWFA